MKTIQINLLKELSNLVITRDSIRLVFEKINQVLERNSDVKIYLDFKGVDFISRAAAHELYYNGLAVSKTKNIVFLNMGQDVRKMMEVVKKSSFKSNLLILERHYVSNSIEFNSLLSF